jgi:hypothetical protein
MENISNRKELVVVIWNLEGHMDRQDPHIWNQHSEMHKVMHVLRKKRFTIWGKFFR